MLADPEVHTQPGATRGPTRHTAHLCMQSNRIWRSRWEGSCWRCRLRTKRDPKVSSLLSAATSVTSGSNLHQVYNKVLVQLLGGRQARLYHVRGSVCALLLGTCGRGHSVGEKRLWCWWDAFALYNRAFLGREVFVLLLGACGRGHSV